MLVVKVVHKVVPGLRGPRSSRKGSWSMRHSLRKTNAKDLRNVFRLTYRQPVPLNLWIRTMCYLSVKCCLEPVHSGCAIDLRCEKMCLSGSVTFSPDVWEEILLYATKQ